MTFRAQNLTFFIYTNFTKNAFSLQMISCVIVVNYITIKKVIEGKCLCLVMYDVILNIDKIIFQT